jgi:A/G-specific adenine glycosylase
MRRCPRKPVTTFPLLNESRVASSDVLEVNELRRRLLAWFDREKRAMPWRASTDPYRVWVSEIMLQQTQVATVIPYYERFMRRFPTLESLAGASEDDVLSLWAGLGYYSRARHLLAAARAVRERGSFPDSFDELLRLPGFGRYTAGAVGSIAFGLRIPCIDGNVIRVVSRLLALEEDPRKGAARKTVEEAAAEWVDPRRPGDFNQAMMELGAVVCTRDAPYCLLCPLRELCLAHAQGLEGDIPPRRPSRTEARVAVIGVCRDNRGRVLIAKRLAGGMFAGMWEFPGGRVEPGETLPQALAREFKEEVGLDVDVGEKLAVIKHAYTRFRVTLHAFSVRPRAGRPESLQVAETRWAKPEELSALACPAANRRLIEILGEKKTAKEKKALTRNDS